MYYVLSVLLLTNYYTTSLHDIIYFYYFWIVSHRNAELVVSPISLAKAKPIDI